MKNFKTKSLIKSVVFSAMFGLAITSCSDSDESGATDYDPTKPIALESFAPTSGPRSTQVILKGANFGTDRDNVKVYFNEKEAPVISAKGNKLLVLAPRLPGEQCQIKVCVGEQESVFKETFDYIIQTSVTTLVGGKQATTPTTGTVSLSEGQFKFKPDRGIQIDAGDNIFVSVQAVDDGMASKDYVYVINEEADKIKQIPNTDFSTFLTHQILSYDCINDRIYRCHANVGNNDFSYFDKNNDFGEIKSGNLSYDKPINVGGMGDWGARRAFAMNPEDGYFYMRTGGGYFSRFNPKNGRGENITGRNPEYLNTGVGGKNGETFGIVFDPKNPKLLYFSVTDRHCIFMYNLETDICEVYAGTGNSGYLDGSKEEAMFNQPCQLCIDEDYNMYVADRQNHCIRKIVMSTGYVSTVAGIGGEAGYVNGTNEIAKFNKPVGIAVNSEGVLFVSDSENYAIRRVAVE